MTDTEHNVDIPTAPPRRINPWWILTGVLVVLVIIQLVSAAVLRNRHDAALEALEGRHAAAMARMLEKKGFSLARTLQMANPELLTDNGQQFALGYFKALLDGDEQIAYIVLIDRDGQVSATTNMRLDDGGLARQNIREVRRHTAVAGADLEVVGPVLNSGGQQIGTVRVGLISRGDAVLPTTE